MDEKKAYEVLDCVNAATESAAEQRQLVAYLCGNCDPVVAHVACALRELLKEQAAQLESAADVLWPHVGPTGVEDDGFDEDEPTVQIERPIPTEITPCVVEGSVGDAVGAWR